jgi:hypothetical protein
MVILRDRPLAKGHFYEGSIGDTRGWMKMTFSGVKYVSEHIESKSKIKNTKKVTKSRP